MKTVTVGELIDEGAASIQTGPFGTQLKAAEYTSDGRPLLNVRNVGFGEVRADDLEFVSDETAERLHAHVLQAEDIVFGRKGAVERHAFIPLEFAGAVQGSDCIRLRLDRSRILPRFASFALRTKAHLSWMQNQSSHGATMASLNQEIVRRIELPVLPLDTQSRVVAVLGALDDLIENNRRRIALLDHTAQATYREWFVRFRYPGHEDTVLVDSRLGPIPAGWSAARLGDVIELRYGKALKASSRNGGPVAVVGSSGVVGWHDELLVSGPAVVVGRKGNVGSVTWIPGDCWPIDTTYYVTTDLPLHFVYRMLGEIEFIDSHAAVPGLSRDQAYSIDVLRPGIEVASLFENTASELSAMSSALESQATVLSRIRDALLPKLVTGAIDVSTLDLDALLEEPAA